MSKLRACILAVAAIACASAPTVVMAQATTVAHAKSKDCRGFRAVGSGLTESIASLMATQGAINLAENRGYTVQGDAKLVSCTSGGIFGMECAATSYACRLPQ